MKWVTLLPLSFFILFFGCTQYIMPGGMQISDSLLEDLSEDLAEINLMIEHARSEYEKELKEEAVQVQVIEPWSRVSGLKFAITSPSERNLYDVLAKSKIRAPLAKGYEVADVMKLKGKEGVFMAVVNPEMLANVWAGPSKQTTAGSYAVKFYAPALAYDSKSFEAVRKYVSLTSKLEEVARKILEKLTEIKEAYRNSPIYIEGFSIQLPMISVNIQFKFR
jgi:hypothetical protein